MKVFQDKSKDDKIEIIARELNNMIKQKKKTENILEEYDIKCKSLEEKCHTYEKSLEKK